MKSEQQYINLYAENRQLVAQGSSSLMNEKREQAYKDFSLLGFPSQKVERYKYTDVAEAFAPDYGVNLKRLGTSVSHNDLFRCNVPNMSTHLYSVVNDTVIDKPLLESSLPKGVFVGSLKEASERMPDLVRRYYGKIAPTDKDSLTALNTMLAQDGIFIYVPENIKMTRTIQVVNTLSSALPLMANRRVIIALGEGAEASVLFCDHAATGEKFLTTQVAEIFLDKDSSLHLYSLEETHIENTRFANTYIEQKAGSSLEMNTITLTCGLTRNRIDVSLKGENAKTSVLGCVVADKKQKVDNNVLIDHVAGRCKSNVLYKYVLSGESVGAFAGHVLVRSDSQHTESQQTNSNLCASPYARMFTQPMLEIYADDVKCNHGSTVGQLNEQALFYMQQRGVPAAEARLLLQHAFVDEVIRLVALEPLRNRLSHLVEMRFRGELEKCKGCGICK